MTTVRAGHNSFNHKFAGYFLLFMAAFWTPLYFVRDYPHLGLAWHLPFPAWVPAVGQPLGDLMKVAMYAWFGFYFLNYANRRASLARRKQDALQMAVLMCMFFAAHMALVPWYFLAAGLLLGIWGYRREMRDIRTEEKAAVFEAAWHLRVDARRNTANVP